MTSIPPEILHEDAYLSMVLGAQRIVRARGAVAYQMPPNTYADYFRRRLRDNLSDLQLASLYGEQYRAFVRRGRDQQSRRERRAPLTLGEQVFKRVTFPQTWLLKGLDQIAAYRARMLFRQRRIRWYTIASTKDAPPDRGGPRQRR